MIPSTAEERIAAAERALRTNSPRMAMLYMKLASEELEERQFERLAAIQQVAARVVRIFEQIREGLYPVLLEVSSSVQDVAQSFDRFRHTIANSIPEQKESR